MKKLFILAVMAVMSFSAFGQAAKKPTLMVVPSDNWFTMNGLMKVIEGVGEKNYVPMFEEAFLTRNDLKDAITSISDMFKNQGFPLKDMESNLKAIKARAAEDLASNDEAEESLLDQVKKRAKSDIILELTYEVKTMGGIQKKVSATLRAVDAYTSKQVAKLQNESEYSAAFDLKNALLEAVEGGFDEMVQGMTSYFDDMAQNGREVYLRVRGESGADINFQEEEVEGMVLQEFIEDWMANNCVNGSFSTLDATDTMLEYEQVRIPLFNEKGRAVDTQSWARGLRDALKAAGYSSTKLQMRGLGEATVFIKR